MSKKKRTVVIALAAAALVAVGAVLGAILSSGEYSGRVTDIETGEPIANVSVTDGRNVVKTASDGAFTLSGYRHTRFITVTTPAGYTTEEYYIPVKKDTAAYDFKLTKSNATAKDAHSFLQISDTEIGENGVGEWINHIKKVAGETDPAFLIHTGDICYEPGLKRHKSDMNTENIGVPVRYIIGNHDYVDGKYGEELFESIYGPVWYSFDIGNIHYVVTPIQFGDFKSGYGMNDRWKWLKNDLENTDPDKKVVIFNHSNAPSPDYVISTGLKKLDLKEHNLISWIFGHYHYNYVQENNGVLNISTARPDCGGIDSSASGTRQISVDENGKMTTKMYYYNLNSAPAEPENSVWTAKLDGNILFTDTISNNGKIYTATTIDDYPNDCRIYCLDEKSGKILWSIPTENSVKNNLVYSDGKIIAQDCEGNVICADAQTGKEIWSAKAELQRSLGTSTGICADEKAVYTGSASDVTAFSVTDGKLLWTYHRNSGENSAAEFIVAGDKLIISPHWDAIAALDKNTGKLLWENKDEGIRFRSSTPIAADSSRLLVADDNDVFILDNNSGKMLSFTTFEGYNFSSSAQSVIGDNFIAYIPTASHGLIAFDIESKKIVWEMKPQKTLIYTAPYTGGDSLTIESTPILNDGKLIFGASDGYVYCVNASDGKVISKANANAPIFGKSVLCSNGDVITADFAGRVSRFKLK